MMARNHADSRRDSHGRFLKCIYETHVSACQTVPYGNIHV